MSDREKCEDCIYCEKVLGTTYHICVYPVPHWALPNSLVTPTDFITCPTYVDKRIIEITPLSN